MEDKIKAYIEDKNGTFILMYGDRINDRLYNFVDYFCENGHENIHKQVNAVLHNRGWCRACMSNTIEDAHSLAQSRGWKFLSPIYQNNYTYYLWECTVGHIVTTTYNRVYWNNECQQCMTYCFNDIEKIIIGNGGKCLSNGSDYVNIGSTLKVSCEDGHIWEPTARSLLSGCWCVDCHSFLHEYTCKKIIEYIYGRPFYKKRPKWLINNEGNRLELDCFNEELKLALEYNGEQHYVITHFSNTQAKLDKLKQHDAIKVKLCAEQGITLIVVPYTVNYEDLFEYIKVLCPNVSKNIPDQLDYEVLGTCRSSKIKEINEFLLKKYGGGTLLSKSYINRHSKLKFKCINGHDVTSSWADIQNGSFCKLCTQIKGSTEFYNNTIKPFCDKNGFKMVGTYKNCKTSLEWRCIKCEILISTSQWNYFKSNYLKCNKCYPNIGLIN
jgi:hypothetical protein